MKAFIRCLLASLGFAAVLALFLGAVCLLDLCGCKNNEDSGDGATATKLSFKAASTYDYLKSLDGTEVTINGYMATSSPVDGSYIYLMNMPYQSCPFCKPNTTELSNTMAVYPKNGKRFDYTTQAIAVTGTLSVADEGNLFSDPYGYEFSFKIVDAEYKIVSSKDMTEEMAAWQKISGSGVINDINNMYEYVNFLCKWPTYYVNSWTAEDGSVQPGYYLWPADALHYLETEGAQYNYGYQTDYFDNLVKAVEKLDKKAFADLVDNIRSAQELANIALNELRTGQYTYENQYLEKFDTYDDVYTLNRGDELAAAMDDLYTEFALWLASWEV